MRDICKLGDSLHIGDFPFTDRLFNEYFACGREIIAAYTAILGGSKDLIRRIVYSNTSEEAVELLLEANLKEVFTLLAERVVVRVKEFLKTELSVKSIVFSMKEGVLGSYGFKSGEL